MRPRLLLLAILAFSFSFAVGARPATAAGTTYTGFVTGFGAASGRASLQISQMNAPLVGVASAPDGKGFWAVASDGGVFTAGTARFAGSMGRKPLNMPVV